MSTRISGRTAAVLPILVSGHIAIITASNYLVQIPVDVFGMHSTWGTFTFPLIFLITDLTVRLLGTGPARRVIAFVMLPALVISYTASVLFFEGRYQGLQGLSEFNLFVFRIALGSFAAYVVGQLLDITVFSHLRKSQHWWLAPSVSTTLGSLVDTFLFFAVAFYASSDAFMSAHWVEIAWLDWGFKMLVSLLLFVPAYGLIVRRLVPQPVNTTVA